MPARARWLAPIGLFLVSVAVTGCGHEYATAGEGVCAVAFPAPYGLVNACSAPAVMAAATGAVFSYKPREQASPRAAFEAAEVLMDTDFATRAAPAAAVLAPITSATWQQWAVRDVTVTAEVQATRDDHPADTALTAARVLAVTQHPSDTSAPIAFTVYARAGRPNPLAAWRITGLEVMT
ncbi:hypothetical protein ABIA39_007540 [Nocardia sp. GAS34]|uniref:hypothetical protein n=1 Tax=unclassified Nocardia TaxID=2637762 RepID=UPI003D2584B1